MSTTLEFVETTLIQLGFAYSDAIGPGGDRWLVVLLGVRGGELTLYISVGFGGTYLSVHSVIGNTDLARTADADRLARSLLETAYRMRITRVGVDSMTGDIVLAADVYLMDAALTAGMLKRLIDCMVMSSREPMALLATVATNASND